MFSSWSHLNQAIIPVKPFLKIQNHVSLQFLLIKEKNRSLESHMINMTNLSDQSYKYIRDLQGFEHLLFIFRKIIWIFQVNFIFIIISTIVAIFKTKQNKKQTREKNLDFFLSNLSARYFTSFAFKWNLWISKTSQIQIS